MHNSIEINGAKLIRTADLLDANEALSQLSHSPKNKPNATICRPSILSPSQQNVKTISVEARRVVCCKILLDVRALWGRLPSPAFARDFVDTAEKLMHSFRIEVPSLTALSLYLHSIEVEVAVGNIEAIRRSSVENSQ